MWPEVCQNSSNEMVLFSNTTAQLWQWLLWEPWSMYREASGFWVVLLVYSNTISDVSGGQVFSPQPIVNKRILFANALTACMGLPLFVA